MHQPTSSGTADTGGWIDPSVELIGFRLSTATVLFHAAVAERLGVAATDMKCYSLLRQTGPLAAGALAERVNLATATMTAVIDRLEKAGLVHRVPDPADRRRVVVAVSTSPEQERTIAVLYAPMGRAITDVIASYGDAERATITDFLTKATAVLEVATTQLRNEAPSSARRGA